MQLRGVLTQGALIPKNIEASLPAGLPKVSNVLMSLAQSVPDTPDIPLPMSLASPGLPTSFPEIIKGAESMIPTGFPRPSGILPGMQTYRSINTTNSGAVGGRIMGGGYRSIG